jgi:NAD(P)-dependent dehydrogenase (short-subunit alcohol dehydrogenase family)
MGEEQAARRISATFPDLAGKAALVSGTSRGIGCGIAEFLGRQEMKLALCARSAEAGEAFAGKLRSMNIECFFVQADLATPEGAQRVFGEAVARYERIDLLVNNAANLRSRPILKLDEQEYRASFEANMRMVYGLSYLAARHMVEKGGGSIVHLSSVGGLRAHHGLSGYDASKGAIDALTRSMAIELAEHGIRVNAVAPGLTLTRTLRPEWAEKYKQQTGGIPLGRAATPEEIGAAVAFLASDAGGYVTGQVLYVDGGLTAQLTPPGINI